jgi:hypothetical protein
MTAARWRPALSFAGTGFVTPVYRFETREDKPKFLLQAGNALSNGTRSNRGDKTAIELFIAGVRGWEAGLRRRMDDGKPFPE